MYKRLFNGRLSIYRDTYIYDDVHKFSYILVRILCLGIDSLYDIVWLGIHYIITNTFYHNNASDYYMTLFFLSSSLFCCIFYYFVILFYFFSSYISQFERKWVGTCCVYSIQVGYLVVTLCSVILFLFFVYFHFNKFIVVAWYNLEYIQWYCVTYSHITYHITLSVSLLVHCNIWRK